MNSTKIELFQDFLIEQGLAEATAKKYANHCKNTHSQYYEYIQKWLAKFETYLSDKYTDFEVFLINSGYSIRTVKTYSSALTVGSDSRHYEYAKPLFDRMIEKQGGSRPVELPKPVEKQNPIVKRELDTLQTIEHILTMNVSDEVKLTLIKALF
jgi:hypothetical protein